MSTTHQTSTAFKFSISKVNCLGAIVFTIGCSVLVANAILTFLPYFKPTWQPPHWVLLFQAALSIMSSTLFVVGGVLGLVYVAKANREESYDSKSGRNTTSEVSCDDVEKGHKDFNNNPQDLAGPMEPSSEDKDSKLEGSSYTENTVYGTLIGRLALNSHEIWRYYVHEIGFLITLIFLCSSLVFLGCAIAAIVSIVKIGKVAQCIRYPQIVGASGFAAASLRIMIQTQETWWKPAWRHRRWYVGAGNLVGSIGFIFCSCFGLFENVYWARYQFGMSYLWGSWFFLIASAVQWHRTMKKRAVDKTKEVGQ